MSCESLVCAACSGVVADGRCPTCRASRAQVHRHPPELPAAAMLGLAAFLCLVLLLLTALH